jgi:hypothetical protein
MLMARFALVLVLAACGGSSTTTDAASDPQAGALCTGAVYDTCTTSDQCSSQNCHLFNGAALQVCTQTCNATTPCPNDVTGATVACNNMNICKPAVANNCHR